MTCAPVVLFVYNRIDHTRRTVEALSRNMLARNTNLIIFSDAERSLDHREAVDEVRAYLTGIKGFRRVTIYYRPYNFGLAKSIIEGVTEVLKSYDSIIVLEDDIVTSPIFLKYMNQALTRFEEDERVISIHGYVYPTKENLPEAFFLKGADCWGWGTWKRGWKLFNSNGEELLECIKNRKLIKEFDFDSTYPFFRMLKDQINGKNDSWAIRWYASAFLANKLTLYPGRSLVFNIGNDGSGMHCKKVRGYDTVLSEVPINLSNIGEVKNSHEAREAFKAFFRTTKTSSWKLLIRKIESFFKL